MGSDSRFVMDLIIREYPEVFSGFNSLIDVGGGNGMAAKTIANAFHILSGPAIPPDEMVEFIAGDMMKYIPPVNAILLKYVLHDWSDEDCVKILTVCRKAICSEKAPGKKIIIDTVVGSPSDTIYEAQLLLDLVMMGMASDSHLVVNMVLRECAEVFLGARSLVDVGGGNGTIAKAIANAFPHIKCTVLDLPHVIHGSPTDGTVEFVAGDMMHFVPSADVALLKFVLHDWSNEDCVRILTRCKEAITKKEGGGKVIIIDTVIGSQSQQILEAQFSMDICMMTLTTGKEREEEEWHKIFLESGFTRYKIMSILGVRALIDVYP
uniref:O-methyltransferase C-terminal domain-containing protein n=1 Tax=Oryza punctata TaxID=4537 RepID=A0A0E0LVJ4_ORYPU